ncbi:MAG: methylenetetrahydrofolate reductase, partial [Planctomycetota bacterium]
VFSFEFFPPKTDAGAETLMRTAADLKASVEPDFISVTYGAGGSTRDRTHAVITRIQDELGLTGLAHLTCVGSTA